MKQMLVIAALATGMAMMLPAAELLPLDMGNYWIYRDQKSGTEFTVRVGQPVWTQDGKLYHYVTGFGDTSVIARNDERGRIVALNPETGAESVLIAFDARPGDWWEAPGRQCPHEGRTQDQRPAYDGPLGHWQQTVQVEYRPMGCGDGGVALEVFAENIGMLRRVTSGIAGPGTFDLVYGRVGSLIIESVDRGRFSISLDALADRTKLRATLRVDIGYTPRMLLRFPTTQWFEVVLRDPTGKVVWTWSQDKHFDPIPSQRAVGNVWTTAVELPRPEGEWHDYTVEAWLTTSPDSPRFAASARVPPPPPILE